MLNKIVTGMVLAAALPAVADAATLAYDFSVMGASYAQGLLTTDDTPFAPNQFNITSISGTVNSLTIDGLVPNGSGPPPYTITSNNLMTTYDNVLYTSPASYLDQYGIAFTVGNSVYSIFDAVADCASNGCATPPTAQYALASDSGADPIYGTLTLTPKGAVPEVSTWAMIIVGFGMMGGSIRYSRKGRPLAA